MRHLIPKLILALMATRCLLPAQEETSRPKVDFEAFRIISERNIFDPNRSTRAARTTSTRGSEGRVTTETFSLLGTMSYEKGTFAVFDGSSSQYRGVLKPSDTIAGYRVAAIEPNHVVLETDEKSVTLPVGSQMRRQDQGEWSVGARAETIGSARPTARTADRGGADRFTGRNMGRGGTTTRPAGSGRTAASETSSSGSDNAASSADENEILKRLMQQREQELNR